MGHFIIFWLIGSLINLVAHTAAVKRAAGQITVGDLIVLFLESLFSWLSLIYMAYRCLDSIDFWDKKLF